MEIPDPKDGLEALMKLPPMELVLHPVSALSLLAHIQVAMRHPVVQRNLMRRDTSTEKVLEIASALQSYLSEASPEIKALCAAGWNPREDR